MLVLFFTRLVYSLVLQDRSLTERTNSFVPFSEIVRSLTELVHSLTKQIRLLSKHVDSLNEMLASLAELARSLTELTISIPSFELVRSRTIQPHSKVMFYIP